MIKIAKWTEVYLYLIYMMFLDICGGVLGGLKGHLALAPSVVVCPGQPPSSRGLGVYHFTTFTFAFSVRLAGLGSINCIDTSPNLPL